MDIKIELPFSEAQKAQIVSRSEQIPTGRLVFEMSNKYAGIFPRLSGTYTVNDDDCITVSQNVYLFRRQTSNLVLSNRITAQVANGKLKQGDCIDPIMQEFVDLIEADDIETARKRQERAEADKLYEYMAPVRKWEEYNSQKIRSRESAIRSRESAMAELKRNEVEAEKLTWIEQHGSQTLKNGTGLGHHCQKQYVIARGKSILGDEYILDYDSDVEAKDRSCPGADAISEVIAFQPTHFRSNPKVKHARIVWLPNGLSELCGGCNDIDYSACEAVEVTLNDLKGYWYRTFD